MKTIGSTRQYTATGRARLLAAAAAATFVLTFTVGIPSSAKAQDVSELAQITATLKKLEGRVATLEGEYKRAKEETAEARAEAQALRQKLATSKATPAKTATGTTAAPTRLASIATADTAVAPRGLYAMATKASPVTADPGWGGFYAGAAFGLGWLHANENVTNANTTISTLTNPTLSDVSTFSTNESDTFSGRNPGAMSTLFLGYNYMLDSRYMVGAQAEGGLANTAVNLNGSGSSVTTTTTVESTLGGPPVTSVTNGTSSSTGLTDQIANRWLASLLLRGGTLVDPSDVVYLLGGYTYGRFETGGLGFGLNGGTVGAGWERQIVPGWTLRAEYRYTRFQNQTLTIAGQFASASNQSGTTFPETTSEAASNSEAVHFSGLDMHSIWIGVAHQFATP